MEYREPEEMSPEEYRAEIERLERKEDRHTAIMSVFIVCLVVLMAVMVGVSMARYKELKLVREQLEEQNNVSAEEEKSFEDVLKKLDNLHNYLNVYYLFDQDYSRIGDSLYKSLLESMDDPYTEYYNEEEYKQLTQSTNATFCGIGIVVSKDADSGYILIKSIYEDSDALNKNIQVGDMITAIEGESVVDKALSDATEGMKGEKGTMVTITIYRPDTDETFDACVERRVINMQTVSSKMLDSGIAYVYISQFGDATAKQFHSIMEELEKEGAKGYIFDIRSNPGGMLGSVKEILDELLPSGLLVYTEDKNGKRTEYNSDAACIRKPMAVLTSARSASAAEIFAGALKDYGWATLVGTTTFGKGIVQTIHALGDGTAVKVTIAKYYTPSGVCIHGTGVEPDVELEYDEEAAKSGEWQDDNQVMKAYDILLKEIKE